MQLQEALQLFRKDMLRFACSLIKSDEDAADLVQDASIRALSCWDPTQPNSAVVRNFLFGLVKQCFWDLKRKQKVRYNAATNSAELIRTMVHPTNYQAEQTPEAKDLATKLVDKLSEGARRALVYHMNGYNDQEAANEMQISHVAYRLRLMAARKAIRGDLHDAGVALHA